MDDLFEKVRKEQQQAKEEWDRLTPEEQEKKLKEREDAQMRPNRELLKRIKDRLPELEKLLQEVDDHWASEDLFYRYYHGSFKAYRIQGYTRSIVGVLGDLSENKLLNDDFMEIINQGIGKKFDPEHNQKWAQEVRPLFEAFFHAREMLKMVIKYGKKLDDAPHVLPSGWAAVLYLYNMR